MVKRCFWALDPKLPSTMEDTWKTCCPDLLRSWNRSHKNLVTKAFVGYILRIYSFVEVCRMLKTVPGTLADWRELRLAMVQNFKTVLSLKLMLLRCTARRLNNKPIKLREEIVSNGLHQNDRAIYIYLNRMRLREALINKIYQLPVAIIPSASTIRRQCNACLQQNKDYFDKFVARKMRFIYDGNNFKHQDLVNDLVLKVTEAFYFVTPFLTELHRNNSVKRVGHNHGIKLIKYHTAPERARIRRVNGVFENTIRSLDDNLGALEESEQNKVVFVQEKSLNHNKMALRDYITQHKSNQNLLPVLQLLSLNDNKEFIGFVEQKTKSIFSSIEDVYNDIGCETYYDMIASYLRINPNSVQKIVFDLQNTLIR